jgi:3-oxoacyl-[acyl-carrier-protein] synthase-3
VVVAKMIKSSSVALIPDINETGFIEMAGNEVFKIAVNRLSSLAQDTLKACDMDSDELDWMVPHQANIPLKKY